MRQLKTHNTRLSPLHTMKKHKKDKELKLDTKYAAPLSSTNSKTYGSITQYALLSWNQDGSYFELTKVSS
jgi:hypothetical protein